MIFQIMRPPYPIRANVSYVDISPTLLFVRSKPLADTGFRRQALRMASHPKPNLRYPVRAVVAGIAVGTFIELPALFVAVMSAGAGHGDYVAARMLFPASMLLTLIEGSIGPISSASR
ncbi:MAG: hypothetical protein ABIO86_18275 [Sphingomonas sp.]